MRLKTNSLKRTVAVLAAVCTLGTCCIAGSVAFAKDDAVNTATIDTSQNGKTSIIIHKYEAPKLKDAKHDGSELGADALVDKVTGEGGKTTDVPKKPVSGVKFTLWRVKKKGNDGEIDLSTAKGWKKIKDLEGLEATSANKKDANSFMNGANAEFVKYDVEGTGAETKKGQTCTTDKDGTCSFPNLNMGLYYVEETDVSGAKVGDSSVSITKGVDPFFVTTPLANETTKTWLYNVNVYPKNDTSKDRPKKTPHDAPSALNIKSDKSTKMSWDITIPLNLVSSNEKFTTIKFTDPLMKDLEFDSVSNVKISKFNDTGAALTTKDDFENLNQDTDYTVTTDSNGTYIPDPVKKDESTKFTLVTVDLNATGRGKADKLYASRGTNVLKLTATITAKVKQGATKVVNVINTEVNNVVTGQNKDPKPCVPTTEKPCDNPGQSVTNFATLKVTKVNEQTGTDKKTLRDAEFEVYAMKDKNAAPTTNDAVTSSADNKKVDGVTLITDTKGEASVELFVGNGDTTSKRYCIVETKAPAGYNLSNTPTCYNLTVESAADAATNNSQEVKNKLSTALDKIVGALPMTGARGLVLLTAFGIVGLGGTLFYIITRRRKEQEEA
ncbi:SpaH/EbpB family LPXTG-anchored major pilin [Gardnerella vaginalis]|uniref:SpaH/EbpB family LPXTG-anchored major pilin n=1 Tax=Gardnerella vaginalis TaxID=2702 RepID=UPI0039F09A5A